MEAARARSYARAIGVSNFDPHELDQVLENAQIFDFELSAADMADLDALDRSGGTREATERKWW